jgi:hypothetical protein
MTYFRATFWLEGTEEAYDLHLPVCYRCSEPTEKEKEIVMNTGIAKSGSASAWGDLYQAALFEVDKNKLKQRMADAEMALVLRARELFQAQGDHIEEETAVDDAMYALHALRSIAENHKPSIHAVIAENELAA